MNTGKKEEKKRLLMNKIVKIDTKKYKIAELNLDNLACEFGGKVLEGMYDKSLGLFEIEFTDLDTTDGIIKGEELAIEFLIVLNATYKIKPNKTD